MHHYSDVSCLHWQLNNFSTALSSKQQIKHQSFASLGFFERNLPVPFEAEGQASWWRHQMETFSALLAICAGNSPVPGEFPTQRPVTRSFHVYFDLRPNKRLSKQSWGWWFETLSCPLWRHRNMWKGFRCHDVIMYNKNVSGVSGYVVIRIWFITGEWRK